MSEMSVGYMRYNRIQDWTMTSKKFSGSMGSFQIPVAGDFDLVSKIDGKHLNI